MKQIRTDCKRFECNKYTNDSVDLCIKKFFDKLHTTRKIYQEVEKKQLLVNLPFLGHLSFETWNELNSCMGNQLLSCFSENCI